MSPEEIKKREKIDPAIAESRNSQKREIANEISSSLGFSLHVIVYDSHCGYDLHHIEIVR